MVVGRGRRLSWNAEDVTSVGTVMAYVEYNPPCENVLTNGRSVNGSDGIKRVTEKIARS